MGMTISGSASYDDLPACRCAGGCMHTWYISIALTMGASAWYEHLPGCGCAGGGMYTW